MNPSPKHNLAFTLTELLVAIVVIALLISIIAPLPGVAISYAHQVKCASNQRQIFDAMLIRRNEEFLRLQVQPGTMTSDTLQVNDWPTAIQHYIGRSANVMLCPEEKDTQRGIPDVSVRIWWIGVRDEHMFTHYPYWMESDYEDPGLDPKPNMWKINGDNYRRGGKPKSMLAKYTPGNDPNDYWFAVEDIGDADFWDFDTHVIETPTSIKIHGYEGYAQAIHAIIGPDGSRFDYDNPDGKEEIGPLEFFMPRTHFGMNSQASSLRAGTEKLLLVDYNDIVVRTGLRIGEDDGFPLLIQPRHRGKVNGLTMSGAVQTYAPEDINPEISTNTHLWERDR